MTQSNSRSGDKANKQKEPWYKEPWEHDTRVVIAVGMVVGYCNGPYVWLCIWEAYMTNPMTQSNNPKAIDNIRKEIM